MLQKSSDVNILSRSKLPTPGEIHSELPLSLDCTAQVIRHRQEVFDILDGKDPRKIIVVGPCSIHDRTSALDYANKLAKLSNEVNDKLMLVMRVYFEKPRTTVGWKGLIYDPDMDGEYNIDKGIRLKRPDAILIRTEDGLENPVFALRANDCRKEIGRDIVFLHQMIELEFKCLHVTCHTRRHARIPSKGIVVMHIDAVGINRISFSNQRIGQFIKETADLAHHLLLRIVPAPSAQQMAHARIRHRSAKAAVPLNQRNVQPFSCRLHSRCKAGRAASANHHVITINSVDLSLKSHFFTTHFAVRRLYRASSFISALTVSNAVFAVLSFSSASVLRSCTISRCRSPS